MTWRPKPTEEQKEEITALLVAMRMLDQKDKPTINYNAWKAWFYFEYYLEEGYLSIDTGIKKMKELLDEAEKGTLR